MRDHEVDPCVKFPGKRRGFFEAIWRHSLAVLSVAGLVPAVAWLLLTCKDEKLRDKLASHLSLLRNEGRIREWHDRKIGAGQEWAGQIDEHINSAHIILLLISVPIAYWVTFSKWRWKFLIESVVALPLVLPPTVLGFYVLIAIGNRSPVGRAWHALFGHGLAFTFEGLIIASVIYSLPFAVQPMAAAFSQVDQELMEASAILGAFRLRTFIRIIMPLSFNGVMTAGVLSFAHTIGEFGVVLMVGGNIPGVTQTVSIAVYDDVQRFDYAAANATAALLLIFSFVALSMIYAFNRKSWPSWPLRR